MLDLRRIYDPEEAARQGFVIETVGRSGLEPHPLSTFQPSYLLPDIAAQTRLPIAVTSNLNIQPTKERLA